MLPESGVFVADNGTAGRAPVSMTFCRASFPFSGKRLFFSGYRLPAGAPAALAPGELVAAVFLALQSLAEHREKRTAGACFLYRLLFSVIFVYLQALYNCNDCKMISQTAKNKNVTLKKLRSRLLAAGLRPSVQRLAVLGDLCEHYDHPTADTIHSRLLPQMPTLSKTTVYNTLRVLCEAGLVRSLNIAHACQRFDGHLDSHDHFICSHCGHVYDLPHERGNRLPDFGNIGLHVEREEISYYGICRNCQKQERDNPEGR